MMLVGDKEDGDFACVNIAQDFFDAGIYDGFANEGECAVFGGVGFVSAA